MRIVIVDDDADTREMLRLLLEMHGYDVLEADDGPAALEQIERTRPDVALVDIRLPSMSGFEVARELRRRASARHTVLMALTGYAGSSDLGAATRQAGFDAHLTKPASPDTLLELLRECESGDIRRQGSAELCVRSTGA